MREGRDHWRERKERKITKSNRMAQEMQLLPIPSLPSALQGERALEINPTVSFLG